MTDYSEIDLQNIILELLKQEFGVSNSRINKLGLDDNIIEKGIIDSFALIELISHFEQKSGILIEFDEVDPAEFTSINGLVKLAIQAD